MYKVAIFAELTPVQLSHLRSLAQENNIQAQFVVEDTEENSTSTIQETPITSDIIYAIAYARGMSFLQVITKIVGWEIETIEDALRHNDVPSSVKEILESYL